MAGLSGAPAFAASPTETAPATASSMSAMPSGGATTRDGADGQSDNDSCPQLELAENWYGDNGELIQDVIDEYGRCNWPDGTPPEELPYAIFDWDNTVIKNDISDQTIFWMLRNDKILQPPEGNWH